MSIPDFQSVMLPILTILGDGQDHVMRDVKNAVADHFQLTDEERQEMLPSGQTTVIANRVGWAKTHMKNAGLLEQRLYLGGLVGHHGDCRCPSVAGGLGG
jgi:restriction system protein